ncbi:hypothetical protein V3H18_05895 [Methylocystis sp. 9N]|uniref:DUF4065 domain-containing protein n=1 Tax=Methylocystis borbori TaxID=3118750 RepID=A0ABU7XFV0_9HYPH
MTKLDDIVVGVVALSGGELVGRIRLQKIVYLLEQKGLKSDAKFTYHHYGPYSEAIADAVTDAKFWDTLEETTEFRKLDGAPFSIFRSHRPMSDFQQLGELSQEGARNLLARLNSESSTALELAATIHWLTQVEKLADWQQELERRKPGKANFGRLEKAITLLKELELPPSSS